MQNGKRSIAICCYFSPDETTPRAFRALELAKEFGLRGEKVDFFFPRKTVSHLLNTSYSYGTQYFAVEPLEGSYKGQIKLLHEVFSRCKKASNYLAWIPLFLAYFVCVFLKQKKSIGFAFPLAAELIQTTQNYDLIISVGLPFSVHLGVSVACLLKSNLTGIAVADYGDPFSRNPTTKQRFLLQFFEKMVLTQFDYVTIPTERAIEAYRELNISEKIRIVPQGLDLSQFITAPFERNSIPTFAYAGLFYSDIRNPSTFFEFLCTVEADFKFVVYTDTNNLQSLRCIQPYITQLGERLIILPLISRRECIFQLSRFDFLINFENSSITQIPSKIIDYKISGRPVLSIQPSQFSKRFFKDFFDGNYSENSIKNFDLSVFDIKNVAVQFLELHS